jgi:Phage Tail Collar Domain
MRALPGVAPSSTGREQTQTPADPIPQEVLSNPIIGEIRRFDGAVAPNLWMLSQGQTVNISDNRPLFRILGSSGGGDGKTAFKLPAPKAGMIIAVSGTFPTTPKIFEQLRRHMAHQDSLGPGATLPPVRAVPERVRRVLEQRNGAVLEAQRLTRSTIRVGPARSAPISPELDARIERARDEAHAAAPAALSEANRNQVQSLLGAVLAGRITLYRATVEMASRLSQAEANGLLAQHDAAVRAVRPEWPGMMHPDPQTEAGRYLMDIAFSQEQRRAYATMRQNG